MVGFLIYCVLNAHFSAKYIKTFHKTGVSTFILKYWLVCLNLNWIKRYIMILVMPENESFQFQSGYLKNQPHDLVKYMWKIVFWSFFLMFLNILMYLFLLIRLYCKILIKTKIETWKMLLFFKFVITLFFKNSHMYTFC